MGVWLKRHSGIVPYALLLPGIAWLVLFYVVPAFQMFISSFWSGTLEQGFTFSFDNYTNYTDALEQFAPFYGRSIVYAGAATLLTFLIAYPLAYAIAFKAGRQKNLLLFLVVAPFFTSFLLRTISWKLILSDNGRSSGLHQRILGVSPQDFRLLATPVAVIAGITYNFLPFMTLPIYVALEKVDIRLVEAAQGPLRRPVAARRRDRRGGRGRRAGRGAGRDLRVEPADHGRHWARAPARSSAGSWCPSRSSGSPSRCRCPGVFAGSLLTFIPAIGDYVNAEYLGNPGHADDRQRHPEQVPDPERLPDRRGAVVHADGRGARRRGDLRPRPGHRRRVDGKAVT